MMQSGNTSLTDGVDQSDNFSIAVSLADRQLAGDLLDAEMSSSGEAMTLVPSLALSERAAVIENLLQQWRERSVEVIRTWTPQFYAIAARFSARINQSLLEWTKAKLLEGVNRRLRPAKLGAVTFWLRAVCSERENDKSVAECPPWNIPAWMVSPQEMRGLFRRIVDGDDGPRIEVQSPALHERLSIRETTQVLSDVQEHFVLRLTAVIDDEIDRLRINGLCGLVEGSAGTKEPLNMVPSSASETRGGDASSDYCFRLDGAIRQIVFGAEHCSLPDCTGLKYLSILIQRAGEPIDAVTLRSLVNLDATQGTLSAGDASAQGLEVSRATVDSILDEKAQRQIKERIEELGRMRSDAESRGDSVGAEKCLVEMDAIAEEYKKSTGLHGKPRQFSADANRARVSVKKAIDFAIRQIKQQSPGLSDHFQKYVSTGSSLTYRDTTIPWTTA